MLRTEEGGVWSRTISGVLIRFGLVPLAGSALVLAVTSGLPVRFDLRTLQAQARLSMLDLPRGADFVIVTRDNSVSSAVLAQFALSHWSFPRGSRVWLVPREQADGGWVGGFWAVDPGGQPSRLETTAGGPSWRAASGLPGIRQALDRGVVVYEDEALRRQFEQRLPDLRQARQVAIVPASSSVGLALAEGSLRVTTGQTLRLAALLGLALLGARWLAGSAGQESGAQALARSVGGVAALAFVLGLTYVCGQVMAGAYRWVPLLLWILGVAFLLLKPGREERPAVARRPAGWLILAGVLYAGMVLVRLDFDGDTYTSYLPLARYYLLLGQHVPADPGVRSVVQGAVYPPGYPLVLALSAWVADLPPDASFAIGAATSQAIAVYRLGVIALDLACLTALAGLGRVLGLGGGGAAALALAGLWVPVLRGQHASAETLLVPVVGLAVSALWAGLRTSNAMLLAAGLFLGASGTLLKLDGSVFFVFLVVPLALVGARALAGKRGALAGMVAAVGLGLLPLAVWRLSGPAANASFEARAVTEVVQRLLALGAPALRTVLVNELWLPLGVALPVAMVLSRHRPGELLAVAGIVANLLLWYSAYAFSTLGAASHMETSLPRILMAPGLAAFVCLAAVLAPRAQGSSSTGSMTAPSSG
jgi:hypothetical protein